MAIKNKFNRIWNSPTIMTWLSYFTKSASLLLVTPFILKNFDANEIVVWYLFAAIISMNGIADLGFRNTFVRLFSFALGGAIDIDEIKSFDKSKSDKEENWDLIEKLFSHMKFIYIWLSVFLLIAFLLIGYFSLNKPISNLSNPYEAWIGWGVISVSIIFEFYGKIYINYLEGLNQIALVRRIESFFRLFTILLCSFVLIFRPSLLNLSIAISVGYYLNFIRNFLLARKVSEGKIKAFKKRNFELPFFKKIWKPAWKTGVSGLLSSGLTNLSSLLYAQIGDTNLVASYLVAVRILTEIRNVSNAPFYSKIPLLSRTRAEGDETKFLKIASDGMRKSHIFYVLGIILTGLFFEYFLKFIGSDLKFVSGGLWILMCCAFYAHRYGALHIQLYLTSNHIISHIADGVSGVIFIVSAYLLIPLIGIYSIPTAMLIGYLGFYCWYSAYYSLKLLNMKFFEFEKNISLLPISIFILYTILHLFVI